MWPRRAMTWSMRGHFRQKAPYGAGSATNGANRCRWLPRCATFFPLAVWRYPQAAGGAAYAQGVMSRDDLKFFELAPAWAREMFVSLTAQVDKIGAEIMA